MLYLEVGKVYEEGDTIGVAVAVQFGRLLITE